MIRFHKKIARSETIAAENCSNFRVAVRGPANEEDNVHWRGLAFELVQLSVHSRSRFLRTRHQLPDTGYRCGRSWRCGCHRVAQSHETMTCVSGRVRKALVRQAIIFSRRALGVVLARHVPRCHWDWLVYFKPKRKLSRAFFAIWWVAAPAEHQVRVATVYSTSYVHVC